MPEPLPVEVLLAQGSCCGNCCQNCPYVDEEGQPHQVGSTTINKEVKKVERKINR